MSSCLRTAGSGSARSTTFSRSWTPRKRNRLFRNDGDGTFTDVTVEAGIPLTGIRGFSPRFVDMDGDRWPELLIAGDFGTSRYFRNNGDGTFTDIADAAGVTNDRFTKAVVWGDYDNDRYPDIYVSNIDNRNRL